MKTGPPTRGFHQFRAPATSAGAHWDRPTDTQRMLHLQRILLAANRQKRLVDDLLRAGTYEDQRLRVPCEPVALLEVVERAAAAVNGSYANQLVDATGPMDVAVLADPSLLEQVLTNLLDNAAKYSPEGSPVEVRWVREDDQAAIRVRDHGCGIPEEGRGALCTRFGRVPGSRIRAGHVGTGLGLYLGRAYAESMGGRLELEATGDTGSTFGLSLPVTLLEPREAQRAVPEP